MSYIEVSINIAISIMVGATSGFCAFKFFGRKWVENWFAKDLKRYEHKLEVLKIKDEIRFNILHRITGRFLDPLKMAESITDLRTHEYKDSRK